MKKTLFLLIFVLVLNCRAEINYVSPNLDGYRVFALESFYYWDVTEFRVDRNSDNYIKSIGESSSLIPDFGIMDGEQFQSGIPYIIVDNSGPQADVQLQSTGMKQKYPFPMEVPIENKANGRFIALDRKNRRLYEFFYASKMGDCIGVRAAVTYDLGNTPVCTEGLKSDEPSGLPIFPFLVRYEEIEKEEVNHALRLVVARTQKKFIYPAQRYKTENDDPNIPPLGLRLRLKKDFNISKFPKCDQVILKALKKYGMIVSGGGSGFTISGAPDKRWNEDDLASLTYVKAKDFEVVESVYSDGSPVIPVSMGSADSVAKVRIYPNPLRKGQKLLFANLPNGNVIIDVFDAAGKKVDNIDSSKGDVYWDARDEDGKVCEPGNYKIKVSDAVKNSKTLHLVIVP